MGEDVSHITQATWFYAVISRILTGFVWGNVFEMGITWLLALFRPSAVANDPVRVEWSAFRNLPKSGARSLQLTLLLSFASGVKKICAVGNYGVVRAH